MTIQKFYVTWQSHMTGEIVTDLYEDIDLIKKIKALILGDNALISILPCDMPESLLD